MPMTQQERGAADVRVRAALGVNRMGPGPDAPPLRPRPHSPLSATASTKRPIDDEIYGLQLYGYGEIWGRPGLPMRERSFITVGILAAQALPDQLGIHIHNALNLGLSPDEISETLIHVGTIAGVPMWHNGYNVQRGIFVERGILEPGTGAKMESKPPTNHEQRHAAATKVLPQLGFGRIGLGENAPLLAPLAGSPASVKSADTSPVEDDIEQIQTDYVFGEVWSRPALSLRTRVLISVAVLQALRLNDDLHAHINVALNLGVTPDELRELFLHAGCYSGVAGWRNANNVARDVFIKRGLVKAA